MQVFKTYFKILKKHMLSIIIYSAMFLTLTIVITKNIKVENQQFAASKVNAMIVNEDTDNEFIDGFISYLGQYANFIEPEADEDARKDALFYRKVEYILTIPAGFTDKFISGEAVNLTKETVPDSIEAASIDNAVNNYMNMAKVYLKYTPNINIKDLNAYILKNLGEQTKVTINVKTQDKVTYSNIFNMNYFNYLGYIIIACFITGVSVVMFSFHGLDIRRKHTAAPLSGRNMNLQLIAANLVYVLIYLVLFIVAGYVLNKDRVFNANTWLTWINTAFFVLTALSISYLIGISVKSRRSVQALSTALSLSLAFLSGIFVPQDYLGTSVLKFASFTPTYWYVKANNTIANLSSLKWEVVSKIIGYMAIQVGFAAAIISIALVVSKRKSQQAC